MLHFWPKWLLFDGVARFLAAASARIIINSQLLAPPPPPALDYQVKLLLVSPFIYFFLTKIKLLRHSLSLSLD